VQNVVLRGDRPILMELLANADKFSFLSNNSQKVLYFYKDVLSFRINQYPDCVTWYESCLKGTNVNGICEKRL